MKDELNKLLKGIVDNPISLGAFSGMIFNKYIELNTPEGKILAVDTLIETALKIRQKCIDMSKGVTANTVTKVKIDDIEL